MIQIIIKFINKSNQNKDQLANSYHIYNKQGIKAK